MEGKVDVRSALMVSNFFPFFMRYWLENFKQWEDEIDKVYIGMDKDLFEPSLEPYLRKLFKHPKIELVDGYMVQFQGLTDLFKRGKEETVMVIHDDTYFQKGTLDKYFKIAEEGKIVTPLYNHYSPADYIEPLMRKKFRVPFKTDEGSAYSFLLYFFIAQRKQLEKTSLNFSGGGWEKGEYCKPLDTVLEQKIAGDTGFQLGLELLANGEQFNPIPHSKNTTYYLAHSENPLEDLKKMEKPEWIHIMGMANNFKLWFFSGKANRDAEFEKFKDNQAIKNGTEMRLGWLLECMSVDDGEIEDYKTRIKNEIEDIVKTFKLDYDRINTYKELFHKLV